MYIRVSLYESEDELSQSYIYSNNGSFLQMPPGRAARGRAIVVKDNIMYNYEGVRCIKPLLGPPLTTLNKTIVLPPHLAEFHSDAHGGLRQGGEFHSDAHGGLRQGSARRAHVWQCYLSSSPWACKLRDSVLKSMLLCVLGGCVGALYD